MKEFNFKHNMSVYRGRVYRVIAKYVSDACTIEDLTQITFLKAWVARETFRGDSDYSTWLHRIAVNTALNFIISEKTRPHATLYNQAALDNLPSSYTTEGMAVSEEEMDHIYKAIGGLPSELGKTIILNLVYGLTYEEIAKATNTLVGTVRSRIHRARYLLKDLLR